jgi:hypothetical protein
MQYWKLASVLAVVALSVFIWRPLHAAASTRNPQTAQAEARRTEAGALFLPVRVAPASPAGFHHSKPETGLPGTPFQPGRRPASRASSVPENTRNAGSLLPFLSVIGFGILLGGSVSAMKTRK